MGEGMVPGKDDQGDVLLGAVDEGPALIDIGRVVPVGQDDALGVGRRPRRVADIGIVAFFQGLIGGFEFLPPSFQEFLAAPKDLRRGDLVNVVGAKLVQDDGQGQLGQVFADLADLRGLGSRDDGQAASGVGQAELEVAELVHLDRNGHVDGPGIEDPELAYDPFPPSFGDEGGPVAPAEAQAHQPGRESVDEEAHLGKGRRLVPLAGLFPDENVPGVSLDAVFEKSGNRTSGPSKCQNSFSMGPDRLILRGTLYIRRHPLGEDETWGEREAMKDKRRDVRLVEENKVVVSLMTGEIHPGTPTVFYSLTRDISMGGVRIMTSAPLEPGARLRLDLTLGRSRKRIRAVAEVRWSRELYGHEVFEAGLQFVGLEPDAEFALIDHIFGVKAASGT